jgi:hypothetical protein
MQKCRKVDHKQLLGALRRSPSTPTIVSIIFDTIFSSILKFAKTLTFRNTVAQAKNTTFSIEPEPSGGVDVLI